jgi:hypothetical protein
MVIGRQSGRIYERDQAISVWSESFRRCPAAPRALFSLILTAAPAFRSPTSVGRGIHRYGSLKPRWNADGAKKGRYALPVHMIKLTETREITPYIWVHPDEKTDEPW